MFFDVQKYEYSESVFHTLYIEIKHKCLKEYPLDKIKGTIKFPLFSFTGSNSSQCCF